MKRFFLLFELGLILIFLLAVVTQAKPYSKFLAEEQSLYAELAEEQKLTEELNRELAYRGTDAYVEKVARERMGYIRPDEIVFINEAAN